MLDGETVASDADGRSKFRQAAHPLNEAGYSPAFDLLATAVTRPACTLLARFGCLLFRFPFEGGFEGVISNRRGTQYRTLRIPTMATLVQARGDPSHSGMATRAGVRAPLGEFGHLSVERFGQVQRSPST